MLQAFNYPQYQFQTPPELAGQQAGIYPVVVVGAGPVGLVAAIELAKSGMPAVLFNEGNTVSIGSRGVCYAKRTLEILDRIGVGDVCINKGVTWNIGRTFFNEEEIYQCNLQPASGYKSPSMINLQQYYLEDILVQRAEQEGSLGIRFHSKAVSVLPLADGVQLEIETPEGRYSVHTNWLIAADGARSPIRRQLGLDMQGQVFHDPFLIADVVMKADYPDERWFWFNPPFHSGQSVLLHKQADNVWHIDFQLGWDADPKEEKKPERVIPRIQAMLGDEREFELEWVSVYTFQCRTMESFRHNRVLFVGDEAQGRDVTSDKSGDSAGAVADIADKAKEQSEESERALRLEPNFHDSSKRHFQKFAAGDDFYNALLSSHRDLSDEHNAALNSRLILLLANHIGDVTVLKQAIASAQTASILPPQTVEEPS